MKFIKQFAFTLLSFVCAGIVMNVEKIGNFYLFAPRDKMYIDGIISALIVGEGILLDVTIRRLCREKLIKAVLRSVNDTLAKEHRELQESLERIRLLTGLLPICSSCKKIRDSEGNWQSIEEYISTRSEVQFTHGFCPECRNRLYPNHPQNH